MLATLADPPLTGSSLVFEPKYDGIRALIEIEPAHTRGSAKQAPAAAQPRAHVRVWSRLGNDKTIAVPVHRLRARRVRGDGRRTARRRRRDRRARCKRSPDGFPAAAGPDSPERREGRRAHRSRAARRVHRLRSPARGATRICAACRSSSAACTSSGCSKQRQERARSASASRRSNDGRALHARAKEEGWEGLIVKEARSPYQSGRRSPSWRKLKLHHEQEFVVGGWTEPRSTRQYFGALLLGVYAGIGHQGSGLGAEGDGLGSLIYVGHTGTGFDERELERVSKLLKARETKQSPFADKIESNETAHWVRPELVAQVRFTEWTDDGKLRHPVYLGLARRQARGECRPGEGRQGRSGARKQEAEDSSACGLSAARSRRAKRAGVGPREH